MIDYDLEKKLLLAHGPNINDIGLKIIRLRTHEKYSLPKIAKIVKCSKSTVSKYINEDGAIKVKAKSHKQRDERESYVQNVKAVTPCVDCGQIQNPWAMDFDHVRGVKKNSISQLIRKGTLKAIKLEITKCELRCGVCHRYRTQNRKFGNTGRHLIKKVYQPKAFLKLEKEVFQYMVNREQKSTGGRIRAKNQLYVQMLKERQECYDCKKKYHYFAMDYDHVKGKKVADISRMLRNSIYTLKEILQEIDKCQLLCVNCHRARGYHRNLK